MPSEIWLVRHGETEWSRSGQHTSRTDLPLTPEGERQAASLKRMLAGQSFPLVLSSPMKRAVDTCRLVGLTPDLSHDLVEWDYGDYEGRRTTEILQERPRWQLFIDGCPGGESPADVGARADRVIDRIRTADGDVLLFSSAHFLRVLGARWLGLPPGGGRHFMLATASLSALGYEHDAEEPVIRFWNDTRHVDNDGRTMP